MLKSTIAALFALTTATAAFADGHAASPIGLVNTDVGQVLASVSNGMTLYTFTQDATNVSNCYGDCANAWPPFLAAADAEAAGGLGIIARDDGSRQYAINGQPLYFWQGDQSSGDATGHGVGGVWFAAQN